MFFARMANSAFKVRRNNPRKNYIFQIDFYLIDFGLNAARTIFGFSVETFWQGRKYAFYLSRYNFLTKTVFFRIKILTNFFLTLRGRFYSRVSKTRFRLCGEIISGVFLII